MVEPMSFQAFGMQHLATLAATLGLSVILPLGFNRLGSDRALAAGRWFLGLALLSVKVGELVWYGIQGVPWQYLLPLHLCDLAAFVTMAALFTRNQRVFEPAYYWAMAGTIQALLTPDLRSGFPTLDYWLFFVPHGLVIAGVFYLVGSLGLRPERGSIRRVAWLTVAACLPAGLANWLWGTNYMYLREKPEAATLMDFLGPWPWYILVLVPVSLAFLALWYLPFRRKDASGSS